MEKSKPYVILSAATSIDGKIATKKGDSKLFLQNKIFYDFINYDLQVDAILSRKKYCFTR